MTERRSFPALVSVRVRDLSAWDVIYGRQGTYPGTWLLFKNPITITAVGDSHAFGTGGRNVPFKIEVGSDVLIAKEG